jgi:hypothetical protein
VTTSAKSKFPSSPRRGLRGGGDQQGHRLIVAIVASIVNRATNAMAKTAEKIEAHEEFWRGEGPSMILIPTGEMAQYDTGGYPRRFENPELM